MGTIRIGISGWRYEGWRGVFYPDDLAQRRELEYASRRLASIEINGSFYALQRASSWRAWDEQTPDGFVFAVKGSRFITHMKRLTDPEGGLANFLASGMLELGAKLGPFLWQFPERFRFDHDRFARFLEALPRTRREAAELAAGHDGRVKEPSFDAGRDRRLRHAFEIRHPSFLVPEFVDLLRDHDAALVVAETARTFPIAFDVTSDFVYVRMHGADAMYSGSYSDDALDRWAERIRAWADGGQLDDDDPIGRRAPARPSSGRDVYVYFDNDQKVRAPFDALRLMERLGIDEPEGWPSTAS